MKKLVFMMAALAATSLSFVKEAKAGKVADKVKHIEASGKEDTSSKKAEPTSIIGKCTKHAESIAQQEVPNYIMRYCTYKGTEDQKKDIIKNNYFSELKTDEDKVEKAEEIRDRLHRRYKAVMSAHSEKPLKEQCEEVVKEAKNDEKRLSERKKKMAAADKKKDQLIAKYKEKDKITDKDVDLLAHVGVIYDKETKKFTKVEDKLIDVKHWYQLSEVNVDAFEWGMAYINACRKNPSLLKSSAKDSAEKEDEDIDLDLE